MAIDTKEILGFAIERASALNGLWNLYIAVVTAVLGLMASGKAFTTSSKLKWMLTIAFTVFACSNLDAIWRLGELRTSLIQLLPSELEEIKKSLAPATFMQYGLFHGVLDLLVLLAIWRISWPHKDNGGDS
jgi:hypothetical protein